MDGRWFGSQSWPSGKLRPSAYLLAYTASGLEHFLTHWNEAKANKNIVAVFLGDEMAGRGDAALVKSSRVPRLDRQQPEPNFIPDYHRLRACGDTVSGQPHIQASWDKQVEAVKPDVWLAQFYPLSAGRSNRPITAAWSGILTVGQSQGRGNVVLVDCMVLLAADRAM